MVLIEFFPKYLLVSQVVLDSKLDNFLHHLIVSKGDLHEHWGDQDSSSQFSNCPADAVEDFVHTVNKSKI